MVRSHSNTSFLILADTHDLDLDSLNNTHPLRQNIRKVDVVLHCGDLTHRGGDVNYKKALRLLGSFEAELRLVIAGNHDVSLDLNHANTFEEHLQARDLMTGLYAKEMGVTYLTEGVHMFTLKNGTTFTVYATPYTPSPVRRAFSYERDEDRFNLGEIPVDCISTITAKSMVPDHIDILMTHGPPKGILDFVYKKNKHEGCDALLRAVSRARPLLHCFGHIHEGRGVQRVHWDMQTASAIGNGLVRLEDHNVEKAINFSQRRSTLMVNAAIKDNFDQPVHGPWLIELNL